MGVKIVLDYRWLGIGESAKTPEVSTLYKAKKDLKEKLENLDGKHQDIGSLEAAMGRIFAQKPFEGSPYIEEGRIKVGRHKSYMEATLGRVVIENTNEQ